MFYIIVKTIDVSGKDWIVEETRVDAVEDDWSMAVLKHQLIKTGYQTRGYSFEEMSSKWPEISKEKDGKRIVISIREGRA